VTSSIREPQLFSRLKTCRRALVAGAGGGFDVFAGLPLALALMDMGVEVSLANLSFTFLGGTTAPWLAPHVAVVRPECEGEDGYFPERALSEWLADRKLPSTVYAFEKVGVRPLHAAYVALCRETNPDAIVLVDGGTDILMFGDEAGLGTPQEDMTSLSAVAMVDVPQKFVACIGFGIDSFHGVCHAHFLENVSTLERDGAYLGSFSVPRASSEGAAFLDAIDYAQRRTPLRPSIVNGSIASAMAGAFGNSHFTDRTRSSELFINPLMGMYFTFDLMGVASRSLYLDRLTSTQTIFDVNLQIEDFRAETKARPRRTIPH
jgi:hypothetical protein